MSAATSCRRRRIHDHLPCAPSAPGLFQTKEYAQALISATHPASDPEAIERRVEARMLRQGLLTRENPPEITAIVDEAILRVRSAGPRRPGFS